MLNKVLDYARVMKKKRENPLVKNKLRYYVSDKKSENQPLKKGSIAFARNANKKNKEDVVCTLINYIIFPIYISFHLSLPTFPRIPLLLKLSLLF